MSYHLNYNKMLADVRLEVLTDKENAECCEIADGHTIERCMTFVEQGDLSVGRFERMTIADMESWLERHDIQEDL